MRRAVDLEIWLRNIVICYLLGRHPTLMQIFLLDNNLFARKNLKSIVEYVENGGPDDHRQPIDVITRKFHVAMFIGSFEAVSVLYPLTKPFVCKLSDFLGKSYSFYINERYEIVAYLEALKKERKVIVA